MTQSKKKVFLFTLNDLSKEGGAVLRIKGLISLISREHCVRLFSNSNESCDNLENVYLSCYFTVFEKRLFQFMITFFPTNLIYCILWKKLSKLERIIVKSKINENDLIIFCEYLDNSVGYYLKKRGLIKSYINDHHGIATLEFSQTKKNYINKIKLLVAKYHDENILSYADKHIFASSSMKKYYVDNFHNYSKKVIGILPYYVSRDGYNEIIDLDFVNEFTKENDIDSFSKVILFVGYFKPLGGVKDLVMAFSKISPIKNNLCLCLVGDGPDFDAVIDLVEAFNLNENVIITGRLDYKYLPSLQHLCDVIVCPDRYNTYSNMIVHLKYYHSLLSNKPVVCGEFSSVEELNIFKRLSIPFKPSDIESLANGIQSGLKGNILIEKNTRRIVFDKFSYESAKMISEII